MRGPFIVNAGSYQGDIFPCMPTFFDVKVTSEQREGYMIQVRSFFMCNITQLTLVWPGIVVYVPV